MKTEHSRKINIFRFLWKNAKLSGPMLSPRKMDGNDFYFSTNTSSMKVAQYHANEKACVYFYKRGWFSYMGVMLVGTMRVNNSRLRRNR